MRTFSNSTIFHSNQSMIILLFILLIATIYFGEVNKKKNCWNNSLIKATVNQIYCKQFFFYLLIFRQNSKHSIIIMEYILLIAIIYSPMENKKKNCWNNFWLKSLWIISTVNSSFLSFNVPPNLDDFWRESWFTEGVLFHRRSNTRGVLIPRWIKIGGALILGTLNSALHRFSLIMEINFKT